MDPFRMWPGRRSRYTLGTQKHNEGEPWHSIKVVILVEGEVIDGKPQENALENEL